MASEQIQCDLFVLMTTVYKMRNRGNVVQSFPTNFNTSFENEMAKTFIIFLLNLCLTISHIKGAPRPKSTSDGEHSTNPRFFEGDMEIPGGSRAAVKNAAQRWPGGKVYYKIDPSFSSYEVGIIKKAMDHIQSKSCIKFIERRNEQSWIDINKREAGCHAIVGRDPWRQPQNLNLAPDCMYFNKMGTTAHELLHAIGFWHEQSRPDRDEYINLYLQNAWPMANAWQKESAADVTTGGTPYDTASIMHYDSWAFSKNGQPTMLKKDGGKIYRNEYMSATDIKELNILYKCSGGGSSCSNDDTDCDYWAGIGECEKNPAYMHVSCRKACKVC